MYPASDQSVAELFAREFIPRHGVPRQLLSDRGSSFLTKIMVVYKVLGTHKVNTTAYHPQGDGLVERMNRSLLIMLSMSAEFNGSDWDQRLPFLLFAYRASTQESTKESPFYLETHSSQLVRCGNHKLTDPFVLQWIALWPVHKNRGRQQRPGDRQLLTLLQNLCVWAGRLR